MLKLIPEGGKHLHLWWCLEGNWHLELMWSGRVPDNAKSKLFSFYEKFNNEIPSTGTDIV